MPAHWSTPVYASTSAAGLPEGTVFNFILNRPATVAVDIERKGANRPLVTLIRKAHKGLNKMPFSGRLKGIAMEPGSYRAIFTAKAAKKRSKPMTLSFRVAHGFQEFRIHL